MAIPANLREPCRLDGRNHIEMPLLDRSIRLIAFIEMRWLTRFVDDQAREELLLIGSIDGKYSDGKGSG